MPPELFQVIRDPSSVRIGLSINFLIFFFSFWGSRKRSFSGNHDDCDLESTRDSVLSGNSQIYSDICDPDLMIIDFEYCAYNYRGFDLANHFLEWTIDYRCNEYPFFYHKKDQYPTVEQQVSVLTLLAEVTELINPTTRSVNSNRNALLPVT